METAAPAQSGILEQDLPQVFGRYLLLRRLSRGGMGEIFLGRVGEIQGFEKPVIIKKVLPNLAADEEFVKRFIDEAQVAIKLNHANIASVYEVGKVDGEYFLAIEYVEGRDLRRLLTRCRQYDRRVPQQLALLMARELANGLGYAHRRTDGDGKQLALVHCDISPPNVMVSFEGEVKVIDFGIAKSAVRIAASNPNMGFGKFGYMAPEQLVRGGIVDKRTDIYAAGVVLYELLTSERLFVFPEGADYRQIARTVTKGEFIPASERASGIDKSIDPVIARALAPRAEERYQSCEEFRDAIQRCLYALDATMSSDKLAEFIRGLFAEEIIDERAMVASTRDINLADFRDQMSGSVEHTVTFARAGFGAKGPTSAPSLQAAPSPVPARQGLIAAAGIGALLLGGGIAYLLARRAAVPPMVVVQQTAPPVVKPAVVPPPVVEPLLTQLPSKAPPAGEHAIVHKLVKAPHETHVDSVAAPSSGHTQEEVSSKFKTVRKEYDGFKGEYGGRLDKQWTDIVNEITFGKADKLDRVDALLDGFRREMARVRKGG